MTPGAERSDAEYVWPSDLVQPGDTQLIYLDLNHWISLAKAATGHRDGHRYCGSLEVLRHARQTGGFVFPLSSTHYMEMAGIADPRQRSDIAAVMEELSGFNTLVSNSVILQLEIDAVLLALGHPQPDPYEPVSLLGRGAGPAFGKRGGLRILRSPEGDVTERVRREWSAGAGAFDAMLGDLERRFERDVLRGPEDNKVAALRQRGWDPTVARKVMEKRAAQEQEQAQRLSADPRWRRGRLRDVVSARFLALEINEMFFEALSVRGLELEQVCGNPVATRRFVDSMPSADVYVSLVTAAYRNPQTQWTANDMFNIDGLSLAAAYCDVVVTERHACHTLRTAGVPSRASTEVLPTLAELTTVVQRSE